MSYPIQKLIEDHGAPVTVRPKERINHAVSLMIEHDFSQLPVVDNENRPFGLITSESILHALNNFGLSPEKLSVSDALVKAYKHRPEDDLFDVLDHLQMSCAVLVVDGDNKLLGIVTDYDSAEYFRQHGEDIMLVADIELMIRNLIEVSFTSSKTSQLDEQKLKGLIKHLLNSDKDFDRLTLNEYIRLFLDKSRWKFFRDKFSIGPEAIGKLLNDVREIRNHLMHFRGEISATQRKQLKFCADWLTLHHDAIMGSRDEMLPQMEDQSRISETPKEMEFSEELSPTDSRYAPLAIWLENQPPVIDRIQLNYTEIEKIIGSELPPSARRHRAWWANDPSKVHAQLWLETGWRASYVNVTQEKVTFIRIKDREKGYINFYSQLLPELREKSPFQVKNVNPGGQSWLVVASLPEGNPPMFYLTIAFSRNKRIRVELYIDTTDPEKNNHILDLLYTQKEEFEKNLKQTITWQRLPNKRACRVALYHPGSITDEPETLIKLRNWAIESLVQLYETVAESALKALDVVKKDSQRGI